MTAYDAEHSTAGRSSPVESNAAGSLTLTPRSRSKVMTCVVVASQYTRGMWIETSPTKLAANRSALRHSRR